MFKSFANFIPSVKENFPIDDCTHEDEKYPGIFNSERIFQALYIDKRFENDRVVIYAKPYVAKDTDTGELRFGWMQKHGYPLGNIESSDQYYDEYVIGFVPVTTEDIETDASVFDGYVDVLAKAEAALNDGGDCHAFVTSDRLQNFDHFVFSSAENFPKDECTQQDDNESDVFNSNNIYQVIFIDRFNKDFREVTFAKPYIHRDPASGNVSYGWQPLSWSEPLGNIESSCRFYYNYVIGFVKMSPDDIEKELNEYKNYIHTIQAEYEEWCDSL